MNSLIKALTDTVKSTAQTEIEFGQKKRDTEYQSHEISLLRCTCEKQKRKIAMLEVELKDAKQKMKELR